MLGEKIIYYLVFVNFAFLILGSPSTYRRRSSGATEMSAVEWIAMVLFAVATVVFFVWVIVLMRE